MLDSIQITWQLPGSCSLPCLQARSEFNIRSIFVSKSIRIWQVTILFIAFTEEENAPIDDSEVTRQRQELLDEINNYNRRFSGEPRPVTLLSILYFFRASTVLSTAARLFTGLAYSITSLMERVLHWRRTPLYVPTSRDYVPVGRCGLLNFTSGHRSRSGFRHPGPYGRHIRASRHLRLH